MRRKGIKGSLTLRIFCVTCALLLSACAVTYGIIAWATPITYASIVTDRFARRAAALPLQLEQTSLEDSGPVIDGFILDTGATVMILDEDGLVVNTPSNLSISVVYENGASAPAASPSLEGGVSLTVRSGGGSAADGSLAETVSVRVDSLSYSFSFKGEDRVNAVYISPPVERANPTIEALGLVAPWLLGIMLLFSVLCALLYSRYVTRPVVGLSELSQRMAELDFTWQYRGTREDEIGLLGRNLNELSQRLSEALSGLEEANAALRRDMDRERALERQRLAFFSAASHELKTPLTILEGQLTGMLEGIGVYRDRDRYLAKSLQAAGRMEELVREILTVSRMEAGGFELRRRETDLAALVRERLSLYESLIAQKGLRTRLSLPPEAPLTGDPALLGKALDNVLSNAVFYAPEGAALSIAVASGGSAPVLTVENGGSRIPEEALPRVFEAFYRADASRNRRTGGSGLGLYIVKTILDRHGADYGIENTAEGVRFTVRFL